MANKADQTAKQEAAASEGGDIAALAEGGRTNIIGFVLRLAARVPFLFIAGRLYGAEALGRFAYAILIVEFVAQLATLGLRRGLAEQLAETKRPHVHVVWDGLLVSMIVSAIGAAILIAFPKLMFPSTPVNGLDRLLPLIIFAYATTEIALSALAYRYDIKSTVRARAIVEPWVISIAAGALFFYSQRDGLILSYVASMIAAMAFAFWPLFRSYGWPSGWRPRVSGLLRMTRANMPLAAADAVEWGSRRLDLAILGLFVSPAVVGIYWTAQQVASLPQKLKTSFEPILGPVITRSLSERDMGAIARQVRQVGFWIIAAQAGVALALGIPAEAVMGLMGPAFVAGAAALVFLLAAEVFASPAVVSEAALIYVARHRNLAVSLVMILAQLALTWGALEFATARDTPVPILAAIPAAVLAFVLALASIAKSMLLGSVLGHHVRTLRMPLVYAIAGAAVLGWGVTQLPEWLELAAGVPLILAIYGYFIWTRGFGAEDRKLFKMGAKTAEPAPAEIS